jgi:anhydro-N-acetylmuramic acid kinase
MNPNIQKLYHIAGKPKRLIIGLMSGTSFDGLDIALCEFTGSGTATTLRLLQFATKEYTPEFKEELKSVFAKESVSLEKVTLLNAWIGSYYAELINASIAKWGIKPEDIDLVASHGQSIFHAPKHQRPADRYGNATLQIGDGDHIAAGTKVITLSDFRQKHIAAGGEGAPLAVYGDQLLFSNPGENRILLNIGGIANFTWLPANAANRANTSGEPFSTDVGPGNTLMDQYVQATFPGQYYDKDSKIALQGTVSEPLLNALFDHPFFKAKFPKTTGPELFNLTYLHNALERAQPALERAGQSNLSSYDIMATLALFSARSIIEAVTANIPTNTSFGIYTSGGGIYNRLLVRHLEDHFHKKLHPTWALDINPDAKEAVLFALLANEAVAGEKSTSSYNFPTASMGKISFPD